jgi:hypothetical protein
MRLGPGVPLACAGGVPLGGVWLEYWEADRGLAVSGDVTSWTGLRGTVLLPPAAAPSVGVIGGTRTAVEFVSASSEYLAVATGPLATFASGDDTPFTLAYHCVLPSPSVGGRVSGWGNPGNALQHLSIYTASGTAVNAQGNAGAGNVTGAPGAVVAASTEYVLTFARSGINMRIGVNGSYSDTAFDLGNVTVTQYAIGCLLRTSAGSYGDLLLRRHAISAKALSDTQCNALGAWLGR